MRTSLMLASAFMALGACGKVGDVQKLEPVEARPRPVNTDMIDPLTPERIVLILKAEGYSAQLETVSEDNPRPSIKSKIQGVEYHLNFRVCDDKGRDCEVLVLTSGFAFEDDGAVSADQINKWNISRFGKAALDEDGDPWIDFEINVVGGLSKRNFLDTVTWYGRLVEEFTNHIDWEPD
jgi:hypothetical protein